MGRASKFVISTEGRNLSEILSARSKTKDDGEGFLARSQWQDNSLPKYSSWSSLTWNFCFHSRCKRVRNAYPTKPSCLRG